MKKVIISMLIILMMNASIPGFAVAETLEQQIEKVLEAHNTSAASISMIDSSGEQHAFGVGVTDKTTLKPVDADTLFRIGSVSKIFTTLSILKLAEAGKLTLQDEVRKWTDDVAFDNPWEDEHPVRIVHLLSHTTGWDDFHMSEYAHNDPAPLPLSEAFSVYPKSRTSRWIPGTRMAYNNSGPAVAAHIVEKVTGDDYETFVQTNFFEPLNMKTATFYKPAQSSVTLYVGDVEQSYWHILMRPSGSVNASANDMVQLLDFFIHDADQTLLNRTSIESMRLPQGSTIAESGLEIGHGLSHFAEVSNGFTWYGHDGGVNGGLSQFKYIPELGIGYYVAINSASGEAIAAISELLNTHLTKDIKATIKPYTKNEEVDTEELSGHYRLVNPRNNALYFLEYLLGVAKIESRPEGIALIGVLDRTEDAYTPINSTQYVDPSTGKIALTVSEDPLIGTVLQNQWFTLKPVSSVSVYGPLAFILLWLIATLVMMIWTIVILIRKALKKQVKGKVWTYLLPILQILSFAMFVRGIYGIATVDLLADNRLISGLIAYGTRLFLLLSAGSVTWFFIKREKHYSYYQSLVYSAMNLIIAMYLTVMGITGYQFF